MMYHPTPAISPSHARRNRSVAVRCRGTVIIITLFGLFVMAGLLSFVINVGAMANRRIMVQHAADATAEAGAVWVARQFNTVALNNVSMSRILAYIPVLDAMPQSVQFTLEDQRALRDAIVGQLGRGVPSQWLRENLEKFRDELQAEIDILEPMHDYFQANDVNRLTHYNENGDFWIALYAMDQYSQSTMTNLGELAQLSAMRGGQTVLANRENGRGDAMLLPTVPDVPWVRGEFDDFERPVKNGLLPQDVDDKIYNRGPWDVLFGWRHRYGGGRHGYWEPGETSPVTGGGHGSIPIGRGVGNGGSRGTFVTTSREPNTHYRTYGEYERLRDMVGNFENHHLEHSRFAQYVRRLADNKLRLVWPNGIGQHQVRDPEWIIDLDEAGDIADDPGTRSRIVETAYVGSEIKSQYPSTHPNFMSPGTWAFTTRSGGENPFMRIQNGWLDPRGWEDLPTVTKIANHIWRDEWQYEVFYDRQIGIQPAYATGPDGEQIPIPQRVYRIDDFVFLGVNVGEITDYDNPYEGFNPSSPDAPSPTDIDHAVVTRSGNARREFLTYLGIARLDDTAAIWADRFSGNKPDSNEAGRMGSITAITEAHVFNNHSWDLWTQMWHAQLKPVEDYDNWLDVMTDGYSQLSRTPLAGNIYDDILRYLENAQPMAETMLKH